MHGILFSATGDPVDWSTAFGGVGGGVNDLIGSLLPIVIPAFLALVGVGLGFGLFRKAGVKK